jgi:transposase
MTTRTDILEQPLEVVEKLKKENERLQQKVNELNEQVAWFMRQVFGKRSEKIISPNPEQLFLPGFELPPVEEKKRNVPAHQRTIRKNGSNKQLTFPDDLPIERTVVDLKEEDKICPETGKPLIKIGEDVSQKLAHKPGSYYIKETVRPKYAACKDGEKTVVSADLPDSLLPKSKVDESFVADILVKKFADHLPLYRQAEMLAREGIQVTRQLLAQWVVKSGFALKPLYDKMAKLVLESNNVFVDEVPVDMLSPGKGSVQQAYMWVLVGGKQANPAYRIYNFRVDRRHIHAEKLLESYQGVLHSDKYGAYEKLATRKLFTWCPCWVHIRRKFFEAEGGDPEFRDLVLRKIKYLFMFEGVAWNRSEEERLQIRREKEVPLIDELISLIKDKLVNGKALAKSKFKEALGYFCSLIPYLKNYTTNPYARLDNNVAERAVRPLALGRKNWLFVGSEEGGEAASIILSLVQTCRSLNVNPRAYLEDVMRRLQSHNIQKLEELLPDQWVKANNQIV